MVTREDIRELAQFQATLPDACALSFYFQPAAPQDKSHRSEAIQVKDLIRNALREVEKQGKKSCARSDLERILDSASRFGSSPHRAKAIFACSAMNFWREFDLPPQIGKIQVVVNRRFDLKPLAALLGAHPRLCLVLVDRQRARFFDLRLDELTERDGLFRKLPRSRSDGFNGYDAGHAERRVSDEALHHFKAVADRLQDELEKGAWEKLIVGCQDSNWSEFESQLHTYVKQRLLGHFPADVASTTPEQVREYGSRVLRQSIEERGQRMLVETLGFAKGSGRGVTGLRRVLNAVESGEAQTLFLSDRYAARAVECVNCGHLDSHMIPACVACGKVTRELDDVCEALLPIAIRRDIELFYVKPQPEFDQVGNIAALLRFRVDQTRPSQFSAAS
jgi:peptide subunit release factor 1 (eRF1)